VPRTVEISVKRLKFAVILVVIAALGMVVGAWRFNRVAHSAQDQLQVVKAQINARGETLYTRCMDEVTTEATQISRLRVQIAKDQILIESENMNHTPGIEQVKANRIRGYELEKSALEDELAALLHKSKDCSPFLQRINYTGPGVGA
jgi:hypothetical protein